MKLLKFGAIDIGSNAIRLLISNVLIDGKAVYFKKYELTRVPIRLGADSFLEKHISDATAQKFEHAMKAFYHLLKVHNVISYRACATSAMREADNNKQIVERIEKNAGIKIDVISGSEEARIIYYSHAAQTGNLNNDYLFIDVGGGSTELTIFGHQKPEASKSFNIGTLRILNNQVSKEKWDEMLLWVKEKSKNHQNLVAIGSGGNINKLFKMTGKKAGKPMPYEQLFELYSKLKKLDFEQRMKEFDLNPDRSDVIVPAAEIYTSIMRTTGIKHVYVPKIGLADGIIRKLYTEYATKEKLTDI